MRHIVRRLLAIVLPGTLAACALQLTTYRHDVPALQLRVVGQPGVADGRVRFRQVLCGVRPEDCQRMLVRLADEELPSGPPIPLPSHDRRMRVLFVPGAFQQCFPDVAAPYEGAVQRLRMLGYTIEILPVGARSSAENDAEQIAQAIRANPPIPGEHLVLMGYSKGTPDIMVFLVRHPDLAERVSAVVSIAGAVNGTPIADRYSGLFDAVSWLKAGPCEVGDRGVLRSLRRDERMRWLAENRLPGHVRYFSLGAFVSDEATARLLAKPKRELSRVSALNDGQTVFYDQLIPGSTLLGYANGDHWAIALALQEKWPYWAGNPDDTTYPRDGLLEAMVLYVAEALSQEPH